MNDSGRSDSSDAITDTENRFIIKKKGRFFDNEKKIAKFLKKQLGKIDNFTSIEIGGNGYSLEACEYLARLINEKSSEYLWCADF